MRPAHILIGGSAATGAFAIVGLLLAAPVLILSANPTRADASPSAVAYAEIPPELQTRYVSAAATCAALPWQIIAAIGAIESGHGTYHGSTSTRPPATSPHQSSDPHSTAEQGSPRSPTATRPTDGRTPAG